jgi:hypothetical protein
MLTKTHRIIQTYNHTSKSHGTRSNFLQGLKGKEEAITKDTTTTSSSFSSGVASKAAEPVVKAHILKSALKSGFL